MANRSTQEILIAILQRDHKFDLQDEQLTQLGPRDVGLDSLSEAELYLELSDQLNLKEVTSPESVRNFDDIIRHFDRIADR